MPILLKSKTLERKGDAATFHGHSMVPPFRAQAENWSKIFNIKWESMTVFTSLKRINF